MDYHQLFFEAINYNQVGAVRLLLNSYNINPAVGDNYALRRAYLYGYMEIVKVLVKDSKVIKKAKRLDQTVVLRLIERCQ